MLIFSALFAFRNKTCHVLLYFKEMAVSLNSLHNINYIFIPVFLRVIISLNVMLNFFIKYLHLFL